jgi:hypothetical protein
VTRFLFFLVSAPTISSSSNRCVKSSLINLYGDAISYFSCIGVILPALSSYAYYLAGDYPVQAMQSAQASPSLFDAGPKILVHRWMIYQNAFEFQVLPQPPLLVAFSACADSDDIL